MSIFLCIWEKLFMNYWAIQSFLRFHQLLSFIDISTKVCQFISRKRTTLYKRTYIKNPYLLIILGDIISDESLRVSRNQQGKNIRKLFSASFSFSQCVQTIKQIYLKFTFSLPSFHRCYTRTQLFILFFIFESFNNVEIDMVYTHSPIFERFDH